MDIILDFLFVFCSYKRMFGLPEISDEGVIYKVRCQGVFYLQNKSIVISKY